MDVFVELCFVEFETQFKNKLNEKCTWEIGSLLKWVDRHQNFKLSIEEAIPRLEPYMKHPYRLEEHNGELFLIHEINPKKKAQHSKDAIIYPLFSNVYFILSEAGLIKIGLSDNPKKRLSQLQTGSPYHLRLIHQMPGNEELEKFFHEYFKEDHVRGEWFRFSNKIEGFIRYQFIPKQFCRRVAVQEQYFQE
jgi:hypothetical protein